MKALLLAAILAGSSCDGQPPPPADEGPPFSGSTPRFATAAACRAHLAALVKASAPPAFDRAVGPYEIAAGDVRGHRFRAEGRGHAIEEFRCLGAEYQSRGWSRGVNDVKPFTIEDIGKMSFPDGESRRPQR